MKKRIILKVSAFLLIFSVLLHGVQEILRYKFGDEVGERYRAYMEEDEGSVDVVFIGSSSTYAGIAPPVMWKESGITAYNIGISSSSSIISYYQLRFLLETKKQKPKLVVFGFTRIGENAKADESNESAHRKAVEALPYWNLKKEMILQIKQDNPNQDIYTYFFPLLRYHSRWDEIEKRDFVSNEYAEYKNGGYFLDNTTDYPVECHAELFDADIEPVPVSEYSWGYYKQIFDLCAENGIEVAVACYPRGNSKEWISIFKALDQVCSENGIRFYNLSTPEKWDILDIDGTTDFYTAGHVNARGATKVSRVFARWLQEDFSLPDHRGDAAYSAWDDDWEAFYADYQDILAEFGY